MKRLPILKSVALADTTRKPAPHGTKRGILSNPSSLQMRAGGKRIWRTCPPMHRQSTCVRQAVASSPPATLAAPYCKQSRP